MEELWVPGHLLFRQELCCAMVGSGTVPRALFRLGGISEISPR